MATETTVRFTADTTIFGVPGHLCIEAESANDLRAHLSLLIGADGDVDVKGTERKTPAKTKAKTAPKKEAEPEATVDPMLEQKAQAKTDPEPTKTAPATQPATDTAQADTATSSAKGTDTPEIGSKDLLDAAKALLAIGPEGEKALGEILKKHGATRVSTAPKEKYAALHADLVAAVEGDAEEGGLL